MWNIQTKIILGIGSFVGMMLLMGWIAINEPARMDVFTQQYHGRSVEKGADLFLNNCATCHGVDAKGTAGVAPALDNPMLFLKANPAKVASDKVADLQKQQDTLKKSQDDFDTNTKARADLQAKLAAATDDATKADLQKQIAGVESKLGNFDPKTQEKIAALDLQIKQAQSDVDNLVAQGWDPKRDVRLNEVNWTSTLDAYIRSTLVSGRPLSTFSGWPRAMPFWAQSTGGPLRDDQLDNLVDYITSFQDQAVKLTPKDVKEQFRVPGGNAPAANKKVVTTNFDVLAAGVDYKGGDAAAGQQLYTSAGCAGCHMNPGGAAYPFAPTAGTYTRVVNIRLKDPANKDKTPEQYLAESIIHPNAYIVPQGTGGIMPQNFGDQFDINDLKNLIAFLESQK